jgi:hypothetical protein
MKKRLIFTAVAAMTVTATTTANAGIVRKAFVVKTNFSSTLGTRANRPQKTNFRRTTRRFTMRMRTPRSRGSGVSACRSAARKFGVGMSTAMAVCKLESGFRCNARGKAGEYGLLQIKPATARMIGYRGKTRNLATCSTGAYWGMKHLAMAIRKGGVWKHNQGLGAKRPVKAARIYAAKVASLRRRFR